MVIGDHEDFVPHPIAAGYVDAAVRAGDEARLVVIPDAGHFEVASGGTLFLDEIGDMRFDMQVKLLRVLEERTIVRVGSSEVRPVDVRVI